MKHPDTQGRFAFGKGAVALAVAALMIGCSAEAPVETGEPSDIMIAGSRVFPESITSDAAGNIYVGSIGGVIYRALAGSDTAEPWVHPDEENGLMSLYGVLADDRNGILWTCNNPPFGAPAPPDAVSGIKAFDLSSGAFRGSYDFPPGPAACNDAALAEDGTLYVTDTGGGRLFALAPGGSELSLFASGEDLVGVDGIAFSEDGTMYINNVRTHAVQRVDRNDDGSYVGLATLELSEPVSGPDGLRHVSGNRFLQAEGSGNRVTYVDIEGDRAIITPIRTGLDSSPGVTHVGQVGYATEGKIGYLIDPELQGQDPDPFVIRAFRLPEAP